MKKEKTQPTNKKKNRKDCFYKDFVIKVKKNGALDKVVSRTVKKCEISNVKIENKIVKRVSVPVNSQMIGIKSRVYKY